MEKLYYDDLKISKVVREKEYCGVFRIMLGNAVKFFYPHYIDLMNDNGLSLENKILHSKKIDLIPEIIVPNGIVYDAHEGKEYFIGYTMPFIDGDEYGVFNFKSFKSFNEHPCTLYHFAKEFSQLEEIVRRSDDIVFADLLDSSNIIFNGEEFKFIDYDGLQIDGFMSDLCALYYYDYAGTKYIRDKFFTKQFDIRQLIYLYFDSVFSYDLSKFDKMSISDVQSVLDRDFNLIGLNNDDVKNKVLKLYNDSDNEYLDNTLFDLANQYDLCFDGAKKFVKRK